MQKAAERMEKNEHLNLHSDDATKAKFYGGTALVDMFKSDKDKMEEKARIKSGLGWGRDSEISSN